MFLSGEAFSELELCGGKSEAEQCAKVARE